ncbi:MAG: hypothetical protein DRG24_05175 [Epsilonproteobacteria bacterium]|nr:MAG: hypothetical protein DRG24_05175 [Campylobacterota bacterium]
MLVTYGAYKIRAHELDQKLTVQITSDLGEVHLKDDDHRSNDFPNEVCFYIQDATEKSEAMGLKKFSFGEYTFILGVNYAGELFLFYSIELSIGKKVIDGKDAINFAFLKDPRR